MQNDLTISTLKCWWCCNLQTLPGYIFLFYCAVIARVNLSIILCVTFCSRVKSNDELKRAAKASGETVNTKRLVSALCFLFLFFFSFLLNDLFFLTGSC